MISRDFCRTIRMLAAVTALCAAVLCAPAVNARAEGVVSGSTIVLTYSDEVSASDAQDNSDEAVSHADVTVSHSDAELTITAPQTEPSLGITAPPKNGWHTVSGLSRYYIDGQAQSGAVTVDGLTYYLADGYFEPVDGWHDIGGSRYYFRAGIACTDSLCLDGKVYFFSGTGELYDYSGWREISDPRTGAKESYYFIDGAAVTGLVSIDGEVRCFDAQGRLTDHSGWKQLWDERTGSELTCWFADGRAVTGIHTIDGVKYYFDENGVLSSRDGWHTIDGNSYFMKSGKVMTGFVRTGDSVFYLGADGIHANLSGWFTIDGGRYLLADGRVRTGVVSYGGSTYYLHPDYNGRMLRGLITADSGMYYAGADGALYTGLRTIGGKVYYFGSDCTAISGWKTVGSSTYFFGGDHYALTGWFQNGGYYYYGGTDGAIAKNRTIDGYKLDENGRRTASSALESKALAVIDSCTNNSMSSAEKLKACYMWIINNCSYKRDYTDPNKLASGWTEKYALEMLNGKKGNCYRYASAFAYLAEVLGYDASVVTGKIVAYGGGMTPHGWAQVKINGTTYVFDPNMDDSKGKFICYMKTYGTYPYHITKQSTYDVKI